MGLFGSPTQIGVSIGSSSIKIAEIKKAGKGYSLVHFGIAQLPDEAVVNREIVNHMAVVDALRGLVSQLKLKGRNAVTGLSGASVIVKRIQLDPTPMRELDDAIRWEAEQYVPFDINELAYDFQVLNKDGANGKMEIMLVASKNAIVESYKAVLKDAGLETAVVDVDLFAVENTYEANYPSGATAALVDIGSAGFKLGVVTDGQLTFLRDAAVGGRTLTAEIQKHLNLSYQEAELLKIDGGAGGQLPQEVTDFMHVMAENLASEIKRSLDFYAASNTAAPVSYVLLAGGSCRLPGLAQVVENQVGLPTQILNPFANIKYDSAAFTQEYLDAVSSVAVVPIGLALRGFA
jgi:type IV pilus assembly protein PilM